MKSFKHPYPMNMGRTKARKLIERKAHISSDFESIGRLDGA
jgi:hypothetical protein